MAAENPILNFCWEDDIWNIPTPSQAIVNTIPTLIREDGLVGGYVQDAYVLIQADPADIITVSDGEGNRKEYHAHSYTWLNTVDTYVDQYCHLEQLLEAKQETLEWIEFTLPETILSQYKKQVKERKRVRKELGVNTEYLVRVGKNAKQKAYVDNNQYHTPKLGAGLYLNRFCRNLCTHANAVKERLSLQFDGLKFSSAENPNLIPNFSLIEYNWHEFMTGISLSIEIAAILLEVEEKLPNEDLWKKAFVEFCKVVLPSVVKSRMFFTRNAVARSFFQQIYLEQIINLYEWSGKEKYNWHSKNYWEGMTARAQYHSGVLKTLPYQPDIPDEQIEDTMVYLWNLLSAMETPINFAQYIKKPTHGLVVFCNPKHEYVSHFLEELNHLSTGSETRVLKPKERKKFEMVHKAVKEVMQSNN